MSNVKLNIERTTKDTIFDCIFLVLTATIWGIIIWLFSQAPDIIPTHFDVSGKPDAYESPITIIIICIIMTVAAIFTAFSIYLPFSRVNLPFKNGPGNERQIRLGVLLTRMIALFVLGLTLFIAVYALSIKDNGSAMPIFIFVGIMIVTQIVFTILMYKAK